MLNLFIPRITRQRRRRRGFSAQQMLRWSVASFAGIIGLLVIALVVGSLLSVVIYNHYARELPPAADIIVAEEEAFLTTVLYDRTGSTVIYEVIDPNGGDRRWVKIDDIPQYFLDATVAIEDSSFYENPGFDLWGMMRALWNNVTGGHVQGASTITQQLVRNVLFTEEERQAITVDRKVKEVILATEVARLYSKDQILEWYVNSNYYGGWAYGIEAASQQYFRKPARDMTLAEAAMLAAIPQYPLQNPIDNPTAAKLRQEIVLQAMADEGYITQAEADAAFLEPMVVRPFADRFEIVAPHFSFYVRAEAEALLNDLGLDGPRLLTRGGLRIYTTLDVDLQLQAECVAASHVKRLDGAEPFYVQNTTAGTACTAASYLPPLDTAMVGVDREVTNSAVVMMRAETGEIMAMVGSVDFWDQGIQGNFNAALAQRQPASAFKPIVYTAAFLRGPMSGYPNGITAATMTLDVPIEFDNGGQPYTPVNIDRQYHGPVTVRDALAKSYNVPPVQLVNLIGIGPIVRTAHRLGINSLNQANLYGLALGLGSGEVSLLDLTYSYNVFNTGGYMIGMPVHKDQSTPGFRTLNPATILRIEDAEGRVIWQYSEETVTYQRRLILEPALAYIMTDILADNEAREPAFERGNPMELSRPAAAKTGTSNDNRDSWTVGYTPQIVTGVWVGNNNNHSMNDVTGITGAAPIWHALMEYLHTRDGLPRQEWGRPDTVIDRPVCQISGLLPTRDCQNMRELFYVDPVLGIDTQPRQPDTYWNTYAVNVCTGRLASASSPPGCVEEIPYFDYPPEARAWALETGQRLPPTEIDVAGATTLSGPVLIISPQSAERVRGVVEVRGNATDENFASYRLDYGAGFQPDVWFQIGDEHTEPGRDIELGEWDTSFLSDGALYTLRLTMLRTDGSPEIFYVAVTVDNVLPTISLITPTQGAVYQTGDFYIALQAEPDDNVQMAYVEFYRDGELIGTSDAWPYEFRWSIEETGETTFWGVAYDAAGNSAESEHITVSISE